MKTFYCLNIFLLFSLNVWRQHHHETAHTQPEFAANVEALPLNLKPTCAEATVVRSYGSQALIFLLPQFLNIG